MKVGIVGSGISGLAAAWALKQVPGVHVTLYERADSPGMDSSSVMVGEHRIDLPLRVFSKVGVGGSPAKSARHADAGRGPIAGLLPQPD